MPRSRLRPGFVVERNLGPAFGIFAVGVVVAKIVIDFTGPVLIVLFKARFVGQRALLLGPALDRGVGYARGNQANGANAVIIGRDDIVDDVRIAVGIHHRDDRDLQPLRLGDGDALPLGIDD